MHEAKVADGGRRLLRESAVDALVPYGKTQRRELIKRGAFPAPVTFGVGRTKFWFADEIDAFVESLRAKRDADLKSAAKPDPQREAAERKKSEKMKRLAAASVAKRRRNSPARTIGKKSAR